MISKFQISALSMAIICTAAWAQEESAATDTAASSSWRDGVLARCMEQYSTEQCQDSEFLEENFHAATLETAHRTAIRRSKLAHKAMRELILQRVCSTSPSKVCDDSSQCVTEVKATCTTLQAEAATCAQQAKSSCISAANPRACYQQQVAQCPTEKKLSVEQLLVKYPKLSAAQQARLRSAAAQLDAKTQGWWSNLVDWLTNPFS